MPALGSRTSVAASVVPSIAAGSNVIRARITNTGTTAVDLGGSTVASGAGYSLGAGASIDIVVSPYTTVYAVGTATAASVHVLTT